MKKRKPSYRALLRERQRLLKRLGQWPPVLRGSLRRHGNKCGNPGCACHDRKRPKLHGPYFYLSHRYRNKTQTIFLNDNFRLLRYHYDKLGDDR